MSNLLSTMLWMSGLAIVVSMLVALVIKVIVVALNAFERAGAPDALQPSAAPAAPGDAPSRNLTGAEVAVISAAAYAVLGAHRIVRIEAARNVGWLDEGRLVHHTSHARVPKR